MNQTIMSRPVPFGADPTLQYDSETLLTTRGGFTVMEVPTIPYAFRSAKERVQAGWTATLSLAALEGRVVIKQVRTPTDPSPSTAELDRRVRAAGDPAEGWPGYLQGQMDREELWTPLSKRVFVVAALGARSVPDQVAWRQEPGQVPVRWWERRPQPLAPVTERERERFAGLAGPVRHSLSTGGYRARPVTVADVAGLRSQAASRVPGWVGAGVDTHGRWDRRDVVDEFGEIRYRVGPRWVQVSSPGGTRYTTTLVCWGFPQEMTFPDVQPWLGHLDSLPSGVQVETDLVLDLVPVDKARAHIRRQQRGAVEQRGEAHRAGVDLPHEVAEMVTLGQTLDYALPRRRLPVAYGWARIRVDADSVADLDAAVVEVERHMRPTLIGVVRPVGRAQLDLLREGVPGVPVSFKSWRQRWMLETAACSLQHAGSGLGHKVGSVRGLTTGRERRVVKIDLHHAITRRTAQDVEQSGGVGFFGAPRSGKSSAFAQIIDDAMLAGTRNLTLDPSRRLQAVYGLHDRVQALDPVQTGGGLVDPLGRFLIPMPASAVVSGEALEGCRNAAERKALEDAAGLVRARVLQERQTLERQTLSAIAWRQLVADPGVEGALLDAIRRVAGSAEPSSAAVVDQLKRSTTKAVKNMGTVLAFDVEGGQGGAVFGTGADAGALAGVQDTEIVGRIMSLFGVQLPKAGLPVADWESHHRLGAATFGCAAHMARRLMMDGDPSRLKLLLIDEAHVLAAMDSGRAAIDDSLRLGPKEGVVTALATHNATDLSEKTLAAIAMFFLFRTQSVEEMRTSHAAAGIPDTDTNRGIRAGLKNGECIAKLDTGVTDRMQWQLWRPGLEEAANTTAGRVAGVDVARVIDVVDRHLDEVVV